LNQQPEELFYEAYEEVCVSVTAVKFGRMSKKQRERVEDEANFHKRRLSEVTPVSVCHDDVDKPGSPTNNNISGADTSDRLNRYVVCIYCIFDCEIFSSSLVMMKSDGVT